MDPRDVQLLIACMRGCARALVRAIQTHAECAENFSPTTLKGFDKARDILDCIDGED